MDLYVIEILCLLSERKWDTVRNDGQEELSARYAGLPCRRSRSRGLPGSYFHALHLQPVFRIHRFRTAPRGFRGQSIRRRKLLDEVIRIRQMARHGTFRANHLDNRLARVGCNYLRVSA